MSKEDLILDILENVVIKQDKLDEKVSQIQVQQAVHDTVVKDHSRRSTALESLVIMNRELSDARKKELDAQIAHLNKRDQFWSNAFIVISVLGGITLFVIKVIPFLLLKA